MSAPEDIAATREATFSVTEVQQAARESLDFLAGIAMPTVYKYAFPPVYLSVWDWLVQYVHKKRDFSQLALGLPRGFSKTTLIKLFVLYVILFTDRKFILVICENTTKATNFISDVMDMLGEENIVKVFGDWRLGVEKDTQELKKFGFRGRNIILLAAGADSGIRGINIKHSRPDVMIFDDIQSRTDAESQARSETLEREMLGTAMKAKSPEGCLYIFIANMYPTKHSILKHLKHNPNWIKFIAGGLLADGSSLWEELQPAAQLMREFQNDLEMGRPEIFYSEVLNDENAASNNILSLSDIPAYRYEDNEVIAGSFIVIDPATDKLGADDVSIGLFVIIDSVPVLRKLLCGRLSPGDTVREALRMAMESNTKLIAIESNGYQYSLKYWFGFICEQMGIQGIQAAEIYSGTMSKNSRILEMFKLLKSGELLVHPDCRSQAFLQVTQFNPMKRDNTDGILDLLTYAPKCIEMYGSYILANDIITAQEWHSVNVPLFNSSF